MKKYLTNIKVCSNCGGGHDDYLNFTPELTDVELAERLQLSIFAGFTIPEILEEIEDYKGGILQGYYNLDDLPETWAKAYYDSFANEVAQATSATNPKLSSYSKNLESFSGAKLYNQTEELIDASRFIEKPEDFDSEFNQITNRYSSAWSNTEKIQASSVGNASETWNAIQKGSSPLLQYITVGDEVVRPSHADLNGIIEPKTSGWWSTYFPPNGYRCRCTVSAIFDKEDAIITPKRTQSPEIDKDFAVNWGEVNYIFPKSHPYFNTSPKSKLRNNFGLPDLKN